MKSDYFNKILYSLVKKIFFINAINFMELNKS